jgi:hypothetical protein
LHFFLPHAEISGGLGQQKRQSIAGRCQIAACC